MIRSARPRLADIDENIGIILQRAAGRSSEDFAADLDLRYVILHALMIIAEAVRNLPGDLTADHPDIPWSRVVGIGTKIKHEYHRIDSVVVWTAITEHLPAVQSAVRKMMQEASEAV